MTNHECDKDCAHSHDRITRNPEVNDTDPPDSGDDTALHEIDWREVADAS